MKNDKTTQNHDHTEEENIAVVGIMDNGNIVHDTDQLENLTPAATDNADNADNAVELKNRITALEEQLIRMAAEAENIRRRYDRMLEEAREYSISNFAKDLLGVMDNLTRTLEYKIEEQNQQIINMLAGVDMTKRELDSVFKKYGLESIIPDVGEKFDYNSHHAISQIVTDEYNHDSIMGVVQTGYKIKDRLLRPAMVAVAKKTE